MAEPHWVDTPAAEEISRHMGAAHEAFDLAYFRSDTLAELDSNATDAINALRRLVATARRESARRA